MTATIIAFRGAEPADPDLLSGLLPEFRQWMEARSLRPRTIDGYHDIVTRFVTWLGAAATPAHVTTKAIEQYRIHITKGWAAATTEQMLTAIRCFCRYLVIMEFLPSDPTLPIKWPRRPRTLPKPLTADEQQQLHTILAMEPTTASGRYQMQRNRLVMYLGLYAGLRRTEMTNLVWSDVDIAQKHLTVRDGKGGHDRQIPIHPALLRELKQALARRRADQTAVVCDTLGQALLNRSINHLFERWLPEHGLEGIHAHRLRHTFATEMLIHGADIRNIQSVMGHQSLEVTARYLGLDPSRLRGAVETLPLPPGFDADAPLDADEWEETDPALEEGAQPLDDEDAELIPRQRAPSRPPAQPVNEFCKGCGGSIENHITGQRKQFCNASCRNRYYQRTHYPQQTEPREDCEQCGAALSGRQRRFCSANCGRLFQTAARKVKRQGTSA